MWRKSDGFTFLELAMVVLIISIIMGISLPRFTSSFSRATIGAAARRLAGTMAYLRNAAARDARSYFLHIDLDNHAYWATYINQNADMTEGEYEDTEVLDEQIHTILKDDFVSRIELEKKIVFAGVIFQDGIGVFEDRVMIEFRPDGTTDDGTLVDFTDPAERVYDGTVILLTNPKEKVYIVYLEHYNGQATVCKKELFHPAPPVILTEREPARRPEDAL